MTNMETTTSRAPDWRKIGVDLACADTARNAAWDAVVAAGAMGSDEADAADERFWSVMEAIRPRTAPTPLWAERRRRGRPGMFWLSFLRMRRDQPTGG
jgi:hypothetical protein